jgi:predicted amidohydrolase YtcJ
VPGATRSVTRPGESGPSTVVFGDVEVEGRRVDLAVRGGIVAEIGAVGTVRALRRIEGHGGALIPGLCDHHIHLAALAAAMRSVDLGPPGVTTGDAFDRRLAQAHRERPFGQWIRGVGYDESAGPLDRRRLDALAPGRAIRVQDRTGLLWVLSGTALDAVGLGANGSSGPAGVERDRHGQPTGRLFDLDPWLRDRVPSQAPDLNAVAGRLNAFGVTQVTDMTPTERPDDVELLAAALRRGLPLRVAATGGPGLDPPPAPPLGRGPVKLMLHDHALPSPDELAAGFASARRQGRAVALHCVTRTSLALALAVWRHDARAGDRVEHGSVVPPEMAVQLAELGVAVVTQPNFVAERGDRYLERVEPEDLEWLYPCRSLRALGIPVGIGTDAPYGDPDPWRAVAAAVERRTATGRLLGPAEAVPAPEALAMLLSAPGDPGGPPRRLAPGRPADLCLLDAPLIRGLDPPSAARVRLTVLAGQVVFDRDAPAPAPSARRDGLR